MQKANLCGYFSLANAMALCFGLDPEELIFAENAIRDHFINIMFYNQEMSMFPHSVKKKYKTNHAHLRFDLKDVELTDRQNNLD